MSSMVIRDEPGRARAIGYITGLDLKKPKRLSVKDEDRSIEQNKLLHKLLTQVSDQVEWHGKKLSVLVWKRLCTAAWLREEGHSPMLVPALDNTGFDLVFEHTSQLSVAQCGRLIIWIESFGSQSGVRWEAQDKWEGRY